MKTAQGSISVDVSKFVGPLDEAKSKLSSFGSALQSVAGGAKIAFNVLDKLSGISSKISTIVQAGRDLQSVFNALPSIGQKVSAVFNQIKSVAISAGNAIKNMPPAFKALAIAGTATAVGLFASYKAMQAISSATKGVISSLESISSKLTSVGRAGVSGAGSVLSGVFKTLGSVAKIAGVSIGGIGLALGALDRFFKVGIASAIELGDEYNTLSKRTGASVGFLYDLGKVLKNNGVSSSYAGIAIGHMQRALTGVNELGQPTSDIFKRLKLNIDELRDTAPEKAIVKLGNAILNLKSPAEQTRAATELFGKAGASMLAVFKDEAFGKLAGGISSTGQTLQKNAENFSKIATQLRDSGSAFRGFFIEMAGAVAPEILELFKMFQGGDVLSGFGARLGAQIKFGADVLLGAFKTGTLFNVLKLSFEASVTYFKDLFQRVSKFIGQYLNAVLSTDALEGISSGLIDIFTGFAKIVGSMLLRAFEAPIAYFQTGIEFAVLYAQNAFNSLFSNFAKIGEGFSKGGAFGGAFAATKVLLSDKSLPDKEQFQKLLKERLESGVNFGIGEFQVNSRSANEGINQIGEGAKKAFNGSKKAIESLVSANVTLDKPAQDVLNTLANLRGVLEATAVAGKPAQQAVENITGQAELGGKGGKIASAMKETAVSSLQRIGGGGGAFGGDPLLKASQEQVTEQKKTNTYLAKVASSPLVSLGMNTGVNMVSTFLGGAKFN